MTMLRLTFFALALFVLLASACGEVTEGVVVDTCRAPMIEPGPTCTAFCAQAAGNCEATGTTEECCGRGCQANLNEEYAQAEVCGEAVEAVFLCVSELEDCQAVGDWGDQNPPNAFPCRPEVQVVDGLIDDGICLPD